MGHFALPGLPCALSSDPLFPEDAFLLYNPTFCGGLFFLL